MKTRVLIATTKGPVRVTGLERTSMSGSVVVAKEYTFLAKLSDAYHNFLKFGRLFDEGSYRLDLSERIDDGESLQLPLVLAHTLFAEGRLAQENNEADTIVFATGMVRANLAVEQVSYVEHKLAAAFDELRQQRVEKRRRVIAVWPAGNHADANRIGKLKIDGIETKADTSWNKELKAIGIETIEARSVQDVLDVLKLTLPRRVPVAAASVPVEAPNVPVAAATRNEHEAIGIVLMACFVLFGLLLGLLKYYPEAAATIWDELRSRFVPEVSIADLDAFSWQTISQQTISRQTTRECHPEYKPAYKSAVEGAIKDDTVASKGSTKNGEGATKNNVVASEGLPQDNAIANKGSTQEAVGTEPPFDFLGFIYAWVKSRMGKDVARQEADISNDTVIEEESLIQELARQDGLCPDASDGAEISASLANGPGEYPTPPVVGDNGRPPPLLFDCNDVKNIESGVKERTVDPRVDDEVLKLISKQKQQLLWDFQKAVHEEFVEETTSRAYLRIKLKVFFSQSASLAVPARLVMEADSSSDAEAKDFIVKIPPKRSSCIIYIPFHPGEVKSAVSYEATLSIYTPFYFNDGENLDPLLGRPARATTSKERKFVLHPTMADAPNR